MQRAQQAVENSSNSNKKIKIKEKTNYANILYNNNSNNTKKKTDFYSNKRNISNKKKETRKKN